MFISFTKDVLSRISIKLTQSSSLEFDDKYFSSLLKKITLPKDKEVLKIQTKDKINYILFKNDLSYVLIGPYITNSLLNSFQIPIVEDNILFAHLINTLFDQLWNNEKYTVKYVNDVEDDSDLINLDSMSFLDMKIIESRYKAEDRMLNAIRTGDFKLINHIRDDFDNMVPLEKRNKNPVRNVQNYTIIMNTLMRKTAYDAGVPPIYVDKISSNFGKKIECISTSDASISIMKEMLYEYAILIKQYSFSGYSELIRSSLTYIDFSYSSHISLPALAKKLNVSPTYLSKRFKKEVGQTLFEYINKVRIEKSLDLLKKVDNAIVDIALSSGFEDQAYYTRTFKKIMGITPTHYRALYKVVK